MLQMAIVLTFAVSDEKVARGGAYRPGYGNQRRCLCPVIVGTSLTRLSYRNYAFTWSQSYADLSQLGCGLEPPERLLKVVWRSDQVHRWVAFVETTRSKRYQDMADRIADTLAFMDVIGINSENHPALHETALYTSHEALLLNYEQHDPCGSLTGLPYNCSAHMLWISERTSAWPCMLSSSAASITRWREDWSDDDTGWVDSTDWRIKSEQYCWTFDPDARMAQIS